MGTFKQVMVAAAFAAATPAWAGGGYDRDWDRGGRHYNGWGYDQRSEWRHRHHHHWHGHRAPRQQYYSYYAPPVYYAPPPVYVAPAYGVHIVTPDIYIPFR